MTPIQNIDSDPNSSISTPTPHAAAPPSPKGGGDYYFSAPSSPSHLSQFYKDFDDEDFLVRMNNNGDDFAFDVSQDWEQTASLQSADELFHGGVIKSLKPPPQNIPLSSPPSSPTSKPPPSPSRKIVHGASLNSKEADSPLERGRERGALKSRSSSRRGATRSLSPLRDEARRYLLESEEEQGKRRSNSTDQAKSASSPAESTSFVCLALSAPTKKWRLKDLFLFRSASEGRAAEKDPLKKYTAAIRRSSFKAMESAGSRRKGPVSAHEQHYKVNRAVSEDLRRKTFLPYKQGILGRLAFNPTVHAMANGFGFSRR